MAITFDAASTSENYSAEHSWEHTVGSGSNRLLIVAVSLYKTGTTPTVSSITWGAQGLTFKQTRQRGSPPNIREEIWYLKNPDSGTKNITVTRSLSRCATGAASWAGVHQTATVGISATAEGYGSAISIDVSSAADDLVVDFAAWRGDRVATVGANQTQRWNRKGGSGVQYVCNAGSSEPGAGTVTMSWSLSGDENWCTIGFALKPATGEVKEITGVVVAVGSTTGGIAVLRKLTGTISGQGSVTGNIDVLHKVTGAITAVGSVTGNLAASKKLTGTTSSTSSVTGNLAASKKLTAGVTTVSSVTSRLSGFIELLTGAVTSISSVSGLLTLPAGGLSDFAEAKLLDHLVGKVSYTKPTVAVGLCIGDPTEAGTGADCNEVADTNGYARVATDAADWTASVGGEIDNANILTFPEASGNWGEITHYALFDSPVYGEGNMLIYDELNLAKTIIAEEIVRFSVGQLKLALT